MHNNNNFLKYNSSLFSWEDQIRLAELRFEACNQTRRVNHALECGSPEREGTIKGFGYHRSVKRASILAAEPQHRRQTTELIITNYLAGGPP